jgi:hypothetical protein
MFGTNRPNGKRFLRLYPDPAFLESGFFAYATDHTKTIDHRELQKIVASFAEPLRETLILHCHLWCNCALIGGCSV